MSTTLLNQDIKINPYASPKATSASQSSRLHPPESIAVAVLLGGPVAGAILAAVNHAKLRHHGQIAACVLLAVLISGVLSAVAFFLPLPSGFGFLIAFGLAMISKKMAIKSFGSQVEAQKLKGIQPMSKWYGAISGIAVAVVQLTAAAAILWSFGVI